MLRKWNIERLRNIAEQQKNANPSTGLVLNGPQDIVLEDTKLKYNGINWDIPESSAIVFVNGDIVSLKSGKDRRGNIFELERWLTIVSSGSIYITDNIKYKYDAGKKEYKGMLGVVTSSSVVVSTTAPSNLKIDAVIVALEGSFFVEDWNTKFDKSLDESQPVGYLTVFGGVIQNIRRPVGTTTPVSNDTITGYNKTSYKYDDRVLKNPPPFFPKGIYVVEPIYWKELPTQVKL
jgi:hypothetical protein